MICTSYYAKLRNLPNNCTPIQISHSAPIYLKLKWMDVLPPWHLISGIKSGTISEEQYTKEYIDYLDSRNLLRYKDNLDKLYADKEIVYLLCCYESPNKFCHRHILAKYLNNLFGYDIKEY